MSDENGVNAETLSDLELKLKSIKSTDERNQFCIEAAKAAATRGQLDVVKFLWPFTSSKNEFRRECAVAACSRLQEDIVAFLGIEPDWLFQSSPILSFTASMAIEGRNSVLTKTVSRMQPAQITQLLWLSISQGHVALAVTLINDERFSREHIDMPDSTGATALMLAADAGHPELVEELLDLGASESAQDSQGRTALSRACEAGHLRAAKTLLDRGADASHRDGRGLTCAQLAERLGHSQVLRLLGRQIEIPKPDTQQYWQLSEELNHLLSKAGFTQARAECQQRMADWLEEVARDLALDDRRMTGTYAEGWANSLVQVNGRTDADSDIDWTVLVAGQILHLEGGCHGRSSDCRNSTKLQVKEGHAQVAVGSGSQPPVAAKACGVRPAQDTCHAIQCCSGFGEERIKYVLRFDTDCSTVHLVRATRPNSANELRVSFSFQERRIMRMLSTVQGQLFAVIKFIFKRLLPLTLGTPGLKTYHAKTLLFFMLEKHGAENEQTWQPQNLMTLLKESLDMMLSFINSSSSPDECMPHFFIPDAPLYFKNAGIGGEFNNTKAMVRDRLSELRSDISGVVEQMRRLVRPLLSENFYFHLFTLLPLTAPPAVSEIREVTHWTEKYLNFTDVYSVVHQCVSELQPESGDRDTLMKKLSVLHHLQWCKCAALCLTAMAHLKFGESVESRKITTELQSHTVKRGVSPSEVESLTSSNSDWAWRFCLPCDFPPRFPFLPEFTQTLFTARLSQPRSSHLYVNFRCLSWSLQAELLRNRTPPFNAWLEELQEDPDLEELLTLAHYSDCREHVEFSLRQMETVRDERRVAVEMQDEKKIERVSEKLERLGNPIFLESWECVRFIGRGGFGEVHEVLTDRGIRCAAKTIKLPVQPSDALSSVSSEIEKAVEGERNLCELKHDNIVKFLHIAHRQPATVVVFMELLEGRSLEIFLGNKPLDEQTIRQFSMQIHRALVYMHGRIEPVIHRDINCSNIIVLPEGKHIKLIDFGLSIKLDQSVSHISASSANTKGTLNFMAPELLAADDSDSPRYSKKSDIWAFGCSVFQMASGGRPYAEHRNQFTLPERLRSSGAPALPDSCSAELRDFYGCCTARDPKERKSAEKLKWHKFLTAVQL